jgi:hypothetical protein
MRIDVAPNVTVHLDERLILIGSRRYSLTRSGIGWATRHPLTGDPIGFEIVGDDAAPPGERVLPRARAAHEATARLLGEAWVEACARAGLRAAP